MTITADTYVAQLRSLHEESDVDFRPNPGASAADLAAAEREIGFPIEDGLRELWQVCNGADYWMTFFRVVTDEPTPCRFLSLQEAVQQWRAQASFTGDDEQDDLPHDERIAPGRGNARWLPFAEFNGFSTCILYDRAPAAGGRDGQIIAYQHDPDAMYLVADTFTAFLESSIQILRDEDLE